MLLQAPHTVEFDPAIKAHRKAVRAFMVRRAWADSPLRFKHDPEYGSMIEQVQTKLLNWYLNKELNVKVTAVKAVPQSNKVRQLKSA